MASVAAAWGLQILNVIRQGLASFQSDTGNAPGRFNVMDYQGATLIADYGHNPDAMQALRLRLKTCRRASAQGGDQRSRRPSR